MNSRNNAIDETESSFRAAPAAVPALPHHPGAGATGSVRAQAAGEQTFATPQAAVQALKTAAQQHDTNALHAISGRPDMIWFRRMRCRPPKGTTFCPTADGQDGTGQPTRAPGLHVEHRRRTAGRFPSPWCRAGGQWFFDTAAGRQEILARRIGRDELGAIDVCNAYVEAQREYASQDRLGDGVLAYAQFLRSTPGTHDGLFWPANRREAQPARSARGPGARGGLSSHGHDAE